MIIAMDIGNTNMKIGIFDRDKLTYSWRISVMPIRTSDEYGITLMNLFKENELDKNKVEGIIMSSVVPSLNYTIEHMFNYFFGIKPIMVSTAIRTGLTFSYDNPAELGADRIVNAVAAVDLYGAPVIVVDLGTATTFGAVSGDRCFLGGAIAPGLKSSIDYLGGNAARLRRIEISEPGTAICTNTIDNMRSGAIFGFRGLVKELISEFRREMKEPHVRVVATGGLAELLRNEKDPIFDVIDRTLTLQGLNVLYKLNKQKEIE